MKKNLSLLACLLALPTLAAAQSVPLAEPSAGRWAIGVGVGTSDSLYAGEGTKSSPLPLIHFQGERFFLRGLTGGAHLYRGKNFGLDAIGSLRLDGIKAEDFGALELNRNGIDRSLLEDRDGGFDMGLAGTWHGSAGEFVLSAKADVTGTSKGFEVKAEYGYDFSFAGGKLTPSVGVSYLSKDMADYYFGTLKEEVARGVVDYKPGAATIPKLGLTYVRPFADNWHFVTAVEYKFLPSKISNSPLLKSNTDGQASVMFGVSRRF